MDIPRCTHNDQTPGHWWRVLLAPDKTTAWFRCPNGHYGTLIDHQIDADGTVTPSVVCPEQGCNFHENIRLTGWNQEASP